MYITAFVYCKVQWATVTSICVNSHWFIWWCCLTTLFLYWHNWWVYLLKPPTNSQPSKETHHHCWKKVIVWDNYCFVNIMTIFHLQLYTVVSRKYAPPPSIYSKVLLRYFIPRISHHPPQKRLIRQSKPWLFKPLGCLPLKCLPRMLKHIYKCWVTYL